jgi:hypothetical protein
VYKFNFKSFSVAFIIIFVLVFFTNCATGKTVKDADAKTEQQTVRIAHPYEFFDFNKDLYLTFPVSGNEVLLQKLVKKIAPKMTDFALKQLIDKTDNFYLASSLDFLTIEGNRPLFQFVATGSFPVSYNSKLFTNANGFRAVHEEQAERIYDYYYNNAAGFYIGIPLDGYCFADTEYLSGMLLAQEKTRAGEIYKPDWPESVYLKHFLLQKNETIDWYLASTETAVKMLLGANVKLPLSYAYGSMVRIKNQPKNSMLYSLDAVLEIADKRFVRPNVLVLNKLMQSIDKGSLERKDAVSVVAVNETQIEIKNLIIDMSNLMNRFDVKSTEKKAE